MTLLLPSTADAQTENDVSNNVAELRPIGPTHEPLPVRGTFKRAIDGKPPVQPIQPWDYPIVADCSDCETPIRREKSMFSDWKHVDRAGQASSKVSE